MPVIQEFIPKLLHETPRNKSGNKTSCQADFRRFQNYGSKLANTSESDITYEKQFPNDSWHCALLYNAAYSFVGKACKLHVHISVLARPIQGHCTLWVF